MLNRPINIEGDIALVPLGPDGKHGCARIYLADYNYLTSRGISGNWTLNGSGYVVVTVPGTYTEAGSIGGEFSRRRGAVGGDNHMKGKPSKEYVARLLLNANDEEVRYADNDPTNLIRENLSKHPREFGTQDASKKFPYLGVPGSVNTAMSSLRHRFLDRKGRYDEPQRPGITYVFNPFEVDKLKQERKARFEHLMATDPKFAERVAIERRKRELFLKIEQEKRAARKANPKPPKYSIWGKLKDQDL